VTSFLTAGNEMTGFPTKWHPFLQLAMLYYWYYYSWSLATIASASCSVVFSDRLMVMIVLLSRQRILFGDQAYRSLLLVTA